MCVCVCVCVCGGGGGGGNYNYINNIFIMYTYYINLVDYFFLSFLLIFRIFNLVTVQTDMFIWISLIQ